MRRNEGDCISMRKSSREGVTMNKDFFFFLNGAGDREHNLRKRDGKR